MKKVLIVLGSLFMFFGSVAAATDTTATVKCNPFASWFAKKPAVVVSTVTAPVAPTVKKSVVAAKPVLTGKKSVVKLVPITPAAAAADAAKKPLVAPKVKVIKPPVKK